MLELKTIINFIKKTVHREKGEFTSPVAIRFRNLETKNAQHFY